MIVNSEKKICDTKGNVNGRGIISQPSIIIHIWANKEKFGFSKTFEPKNCKWTTKQIEIKSISQTSRRMKWNRRRNFQGKLSKKVVWTYHLCFDDVSWTKRRIHFNFINLGCSNILLSDKNNRYNIFLICFGFTKRNVSPQYFQLCKRNKLYST